MMLSWMFLKLHFICCFMLGHMRIFTKILKYYIPPCPPFNVELSVPQIMIAVDIHTSNSTLNWGGGENAIFHQGKIGGMQM